MKTVTVHRIPTNRLIAVLESGVILETEILNGSRTMSLSAYVASVERISDLHHGGSAIVSLHYAQQVPRKP